MISIRLQFYLSCSILVYNLNLVLSGTNDKTFGHFILHWPCFKVASSSTEVPGS